MNTTYEKFSTGVSSQNIYQKPTQNDRIFWSLAKLHRQNVWVFGKDFDVRRPWKIFYASDAYVLSMENILQDHRNTVHFEWCLYDA